MDEPSSRKIWKSVEAEDFVLIQPKLTYPIKIQVPCQHRAKFYVMHLQDAYDAFNSSASTTSHCNAPEVHQQLITYLATILDEQIVIALDKLFKNNPFCKNIPHYKESRKLYVELCAFTPYSTLKDRNKGLFHTNKLVTNNFIQANLKMFERIHQDFCLLQTHFLSNLKDPALMKISASGSDFHKGGQQVLILTYADQLQNVQKIVYKPSPVEADALLIGDINKLKVINSKYRDHFSLIELVNNGLKHDKKLPVYLIVPMKDNEKQNIVFLEDSDSEDFFEEQIASENNTNNLVDNLNSQYGYLEHINHEPCDLPDDMEIIRFCIHNNPDLDTKSLEKNIKKIKRKLLLSALKEAAKSNQCDYITKKLDHIERYSHDCGLLACILILSGTIDSHCQNLIISMLRPLLLDAEVCLVNLLPDIYNQLCFDIDGSMSRRAAIRNKYNILVDVAGIKSIEVQHIEKNFLFHDNSKILTKCAPIPSIFMKGFKKGIQIFQASQKQFIQWFTLPCVKNMLIRVPLYATSTFTNQIRILKNHDFSPEEFNELRKGRVEFDRGHSDNNSYEIFADDTSAYNIFHDYITLNVPIFYMVANQLNIFNAYGTVIKVLQDKKNLDNTHKIAYFKISPLEYTLNSALNILKNPTDLIASTEEACKKSFKAGELNGAILKNKSEVTENKNIKRPIM